MKILIVQPRITYYNGGGEYYPMDSIINLSKKYSENEYIILTTKNKLPYTKKYINFKKNIGSNVKIVELNLPKDIHFLYDIPAGIKRFRWDMESTAFANLALEYVNNNKDIDIVWSYYLMDFPFKIKIPTVLNLLGYPGVQSEYREALLLQYSQIVAISNNVILKWNKILEFPVIKKYNILHQGINFKSNIQKKELFDKSYINIVFAGRLMERKGIMVLIKSIDFILKKKDLNIKLHIFGSGELDDKISNFILENNLDNYIYSHGHVDNLNEYLIDADFTVFPSLKGEGLMSVVLEAMYYNGVVITTKGNGNEEVIENNKNGFLLDNGDILNNDLVDIILRLHKDVDLRKMIKEKSQQDVLRFSWDNYCDNFIEISKSAIENKQ